jgi:hypothetical protein
MIYVYAIVDSPRPIVTGVRGLEDKSLHVQPCEGLAAVVSRDHAGRPEPSAENALRHEQVVEALMPRHAVLPARFGTLFRQQGDLGSTLRKFHDRLARGLDRVRGRVELGLRVLWQPNRRDAPAAAPAPGGSGRDYMVARLAEERRRREQQQAAEQLADRLHAPLASLAAESTLKVLATPELLLSAAYLVDRDGAAGFRCAVERLGAEHEALRMLCTGPWPPYHFVPPIVDAAEATRVTEANA